MLDVAGTQRSAEARPDPGRWRRRLIVASGDRQISTWDLITKAQTATLPAVMGSRVKSLAISNDGRTAVVVLYDSSIGVWGLVEGTCRCMLQKRGARVPGAGHVAGMNAVYLTADGQLAVTVSKVCRSQMHSDDVYGLTRAPSAGQASSREKKAASDDFLEKF